MANKKKSGKQTVVTVYAAKDGWRWHRKSANGNIVSESGEGYVRKDGAVRMARTLNPGVALRDKKGNAL